LTLLSQMSRLQLKIHFYSDVSQPIDIGQSDYLRFDIRNAVRKLRLYCDSLPANLTIALPRKQKYAAGNEAGEQNALYGLAMYRFRQNTRVSFEGVSESTEIFLRELMQHNEFLSDIHQQYDALDAYLGEDHNDKWQLEWEEAVSVLERFDLRHFLEVQRRIIEDVEAGIEEERNRLAEEKARILLNLTQHDLSGGIHQQVVTGGAET
jgi:hypothetical protein